MDNNVSCYQMLVDSCDKTGAIVFFGHKMSIAHLLKHIDFFAAALVRLGFKKGDVLTIYLPTLPQALVGFYAASKIGVVANFIHPLWPAEKLEANLKATNSKGLMFYDLTVRDESVLSKYNQILIRCALTDYIFFRKLPLALYSAVKFTKVKGNYSYANMIRQGAKIADMPKVEVSGDDLCCTMHSGGTAGMPKIVKLSNRAFNQVKDNAWTAIKRDLKKGEFSLVALPVFHAYGLGLAIHGCLCYGFSLLLMPRFNAKKAIGLLKHYNVTAFLGVPVMFRKMTEQHSFYGRHLKKLKFLFCGGDALNENLVEHIDAVLESFGSEARLMRGYGLTEVCGACSYNTAKAYKKRSCGKPLPNTKINIWDEGNNTLPADTIGEIAVSTPAICEGYMDGDNCCFVDKDGDRWVKTGDLGYIDKDGFLFVVDRKKRSVKIAAVNVFPSEIETAARMYSNVEEACAVSYNFRDKTYIKLFVSLKNKDVNYSKEKLEIFAICRKNLIKYAQPKMIEFVDSIPITKMGKVDYVAMQNNFSHTKADDNQQ